MKTILIAAMVLSHSARATAADSEPAEHATPEEVVTKVRQAAALLAEQGEGALETLRDSASEFSWKDTHVFVVDCDADRVLANPAFPERQGGDIKQHVDYDGKQYGLELCETAKQPGGGWVEYTWLRPGGEEPSRKISYVTSVEAHPYQLGAGIHNDTVSIEELEHISKADE